MKSSRIDVAIRFQTRLLGPASYAEAAFFSLVEFACNNTNHGAVDSTSFSSYHKEL
ncbi:uncharacterized protein PHALS_08744 [Plasmopara halstedii]|uniref:Uncharacterized protein n=1 Tax=Plasmopara halstedii TaxID=4781 RepID=A0A0P1AD30_PLAHL|nr:uncharacterized protein PHALS_08744 [Plasmopara halstedii]CEG38684.1 hypothetical protein PHALS_08744 [Plasmopara halstedii]|eukprot:XP_024575053.1 hypothetical protein PHALS_08744 [Plasmopara halstedii]